MKERILKLKNEGTNPQHKKIEGTDPKIKKLRYRSSKQEHEVTDPEINK